MSFYLTAVILLVLLANLWRHQREGWALPAAVTYITVFAWYYVDLLMYGEKYVGMPDVIINYSYWEVFVFLVAFHFLLPLACRLLARSPSAPAPRTPFGPEMLLPVAIGAWAVLFVCAVSRMEWDVVGALLPLDSRAGNLMWLRAAAGDAGPMGFLVSTGGYLYLVVCAFFGILAVLVRSNGYRAGAIGMAVLTWPFFLLNGTRNQFLSVAVPGILAYFLLGRQRPAVRMIWLGVAFVVMNFALLTVISHRNTGFRDLIAGTEEEEMIEREAGTEHEGLNMIQELCFINMFQYLGQSPLTMGQDYYAQLVSPIPRAIWPGKPMMGIEYAKLRGFGGGDSDIGVVATLSTGLIGQGVLEFGPIAGPLAPALLMAFWCGLLARWWSQRISVLRLCLYLMGLGVIFNLGRNITSLALWPVTFTYLIVIFLEKAAVSRAANALPLGALFGAGPANPPRRAAAPRPARPAVARAVAAATGDGALLRPS